jgi:hypothetical protein
MGPEIRGRQRRDEQKGRVILGVTGCHMSADSWSIFALEAKGALVDDGSDRVLKGPSWARS